MTISRRNYLDKLTPVELCLYLVQQQVEAMGADPKLTEAVSLLADARNKVADFVDSQKSLVMD